MALYNLGRCEESIPVLNQIIEKEDGSPWAISLESRILHNLNREEEALKLLKYHIKKSPNDPRLESL